MAHRPPSEPFRIAIDARHLMSSTGTYIDRLLHHLQDVDTHNDYTVILDRAAREHWAPRADNFRAQHVSYPIYSLSEQWGLWHTLRAGKFDLVHYCMPQQPLLYGGPAVTTFHDLTLLKIAQPHQPPVRYAVKRAVGTFAFRRAARRSRLVLAPSRFTANDVTEMLGCNSSRVRITPEAAEPGGAEQREVRGLPRDFLLYVGRQSEYKNIRRLAAAHQRLRQTWPDLGLVLAGGTGKATEQNVAYFARERMDGIHSLGWVTSQELEWLYRHAKAFVFPSLYEGFGLPGLEAMIRGLPVVSSTATCLPEVYGDAAAYFDPRDVAAMTSAISLVIDSPETHKRLSEKGYERAGQFNWRTMAEQTHQAYLEALTS